jgi:tetratricopeptide (TPR) repeat protein
MTEKMRTLRIFISSPGDVVEERTLTKRVLERLKGEFSGRITLEPIFWEHEPLLATDTFQGQIVRPSETDIVVAILWSRLGTRLPAEFKRADGSRYSSGTEYEFEEAVAAHKRQGRPDLLVYRKTADPVVSLKDKKTLLEKLSQKEALDAFFGKWFQDEAEGTLIAAFHPFERSSDFEELLESHLKKLIERRLPDEAAGAEVKTVPVQWQAGSPFRGLHAFHYEHAPIFFGRTKAVGDVLNALRIRASEGCAFVLVLGMSGGGKSSLVRAGVLPVLTQPGVIEGVGLWRHAIMRPGDSSGDVFDSLAASILEAEALPELGTDNIEAAELARLFRETPKAIPALFKTALALAASESAKARETAERPQARLALVVDQMEELFTLERVTAGDRARFMEALEELARSGWVWVIATLRSDFYPRCAEMEKLVALKEGAGQYDLLAPTAAEIGQMIRQPALAAGLHFEEDPVTKERLDEVLRDAAAKNPGSLALLEFALEELYKKRTERGFLTHAAYRGLGGVEGALAQRGEEVFGGLGAEVQSALGPVFNGLIGMGQGEDETITRRYAPYEAITSIGESRKFVEAFVEARLFTTDRDDKGKAVVSVAHEALLKHWPRMQEWVEKNKEHLRARARISAAASRWLEEGRSRDFLLAGGKPLAEAEELVNSPTLELSEQERMFIRASAAKRRRLRWIKRGVVAALAVLTIVAAGAAYLANKQRGRAETEAKTSSRVSDFLVGLFKVSDPSEARGNTVTAREILTAGAKQIDRELEDEPLVRSRLINTMGEVYASLGLYNDALPLLEKGLAIREQSLHPDDPIVAESLTSLGNVYWRKGEYEKARSLHERALKMREAKFGPDHRTVAISLHNLANLLQVSGNYKEAEPVYRRALEIFEKTTGPESTRVAMTLNSLGLLLYNMGKFDEARPAYERAIAIYEKALGAEHPDLTNPLLNFGMMLREQGDYEKARSHFERCVAIEEKAFGPDHPHLAVTLSQLAILYAISAEFDKAKPIFERVLAINEKALGPEHPDVGNDVTNLGILNAQMGNFKEARPLLERGLAIKEKALGSEHPRVANDINNLASLLCDIGKPAEARPLFERALKIREKTLGPEHPDVALSLNDLANAHVRTKDYSRARPLFERALAIQEKAVGPENAAVAVVLNSLAGLLFETGQYEESRQNYERALAINEKAQGADHPDVAVSLVGLGELLDAAGKPAQARPLLERALKIREEKLGADHPYVADTLESLAKVVRELGEGAKAKALEDRAKAIRK